MPANMLWWSDDLFANLPTEERWDFYNISNSKTNTDWEWVIESAMNLLEENQETADPEVNQEEVNKNKLVLCWNPVCSEMTDGMNCIICWFDFQKPHQFQPIINKTNVDHTKSNKPLDNEVSDKLPFQTKLISIHNSSTNSSSSDGESYLNGFERRRGTIIFNVSIRQRSEKYKRLHVGRRKWPTWKYDWEEVRTEKLVTKAFKKDIRIHLGPHPEKPGFKKIIWIYSWTKANGKAYIKKDDKWFPETLPTSESWKRAWQPLDHVSIKRICMECADIYVKHMEQ